MEEKEVSEDLEKKSGKAKTKKAKIVRRKVEREEDDRKLLINRLNRVEGQLKAIRTMVEQDVYCPDVLVQVSAATSALRSFGKVLFQNHMTSCVVPDLKKGSNEELDLFLKMLPKFMQ